MFFLAADPALYRMRFTEQRGIKRECRRHPSGLYAELMCLRTHRWGRWWARIPAHTRDTCTRQKQTRSPYRECMSSSSWPLLYGSPAGERGKHLWPVRITSGQKTVFLSCRVVTQKDSVRTENSASQLQGRDTERFSQDRKQCFSAAGSWRRKIQSGQKTVFLSCRVVTQKDSVRTENSVSQLQGRDTERFSQDRKQCFSAAGSWPVRIISGQKTVFLSCRVVTRKDSVRTENSASQLQGRDTERFSQDRKQCFSAAGSWHRKIQSGQKTVFLSCRVVTRKDSVRTENSVSQLQGRDTERFSQDRKQCFSAAGSWHRKIQSGQKTVFLSCRVVTQKDSVRTENSVSQLQGRDTERLSQDRKQCFSAAGSWHGKTQSGQKTVFLSCRVVTRQNHIRTENSVSQLQGRDTERLSQDRKQCFSAAGSWHRKIQSGQKTVSLSCRVVTQKDSVRTENSASQLQGRDTERLSQDRKQCFSAAGSWHGKTQSGQKTVLLSCRVVTQKDSVRTENSVSQLQGRDTERFSQDRKQCFSAAGSWHRKTQSGQKTVLLSCRVVTRKDSVGTENSASQLQGRDTERFSQDRKQCFSAAGSWHGKIQSGQKL